MATVYIVQDSGGKNFTSLLKITDDIRTVVNRDCPLFGGLEEHEKAIHHALRDFNADSDYLVLVGDPINIGLALQVMLKKGGGTILKWDRQTNAYIPIKIKENNEK